MTVVSAFMMPGSPLPYVHSDNPPWGRLADAMKVAGESLERSRPDTIIVYSTSWVAVLDQLWQNREHLKGVHIDENWHEYGDLPFDIRIDKMLAETVIKDTNDAHIKSRGVNYDNFPIDTGTIVASNFLNPLNKYPFIIASNNLYHDWDKTETLGSVSTNAASKLGKRVAVVVVGRLSGSFYRGDIDIDRDKIFCEEEDVWNKKILNLMAEGKMNEVYKLCPDYVKEAKVDMGFKHMAFLKGALGSKLKQGNILAYEPVYGSGAAVIEFPV